MIVCGMKSRYCFRPIGYVRKGLPVSKDKGITSRFQFISEIYVFDEYVEGLTGLEEFSHAIILWVIDRRKKISLVGHPHGDLDKPLIGVFATRSPNRPTPIGLTIVELVSIEGNVVRVRGLDAWDNTPILDIKPYDHYDHVNSFKVPEWFLEYWVRKSRENNYRELVPWLGPKE